jgi:hypothetical protein
VTYSVRALRISTALGAGAVAWIGYVSLGVLIYLALLLAALVTGADPGGPLAGVLSVAMAALVGLASVVLAWIAVAVGTWSAKRTAPGGATAMSGLVLGGLVVLGTWAMWAGGVTWGVSPPVLTGLLFVIVAPAWLAVVGSDRVVVWCVALWRRRVPARGGERGTRQV